MKILIACEESQAVCMAFRKKGHEAYSCDILPCSGGRPEWHIQGDVLPLLSQDWDMLIAHPTCTYLCNSGVRHLWNKDKSKKADRWLNLSRAASFFKAFLDCNIPKKAIENPIPHKYAVKLIGRKYTQIIQPYMFGHPESKATCLWLDNLPLLKETENVKEVYKSLPKKEAQRLHYLSPGPERAKLRSKTYPGIAAAMAEQWG